MDNKLSMPELPSKVLELCKETDAEPVFLSKDGEKILMFIVPKLPSGEVQAQMAQAVPYFIHTKWIKGLKIVSRSTIQTLFSQLGGTGEVNDRENGRIEIVLTKIQNPAVLEKDSPLWDTLAAICKADGYPSIFKVIYGQETVFSWDKDMERMLSEHINEGLVIRQDDILNLTIALNSTKSVEEFLATI